MKRADQHNVMASSPAKENKEQSFLQTEQTGVDMPSEKEIPLPEQQDAPTMGALPVDTFGKTKSKEDWKSDALDETHSADNDRDETSYDEETIIATASGPDPENADN